ncbi:S-adenosyl-L-methionine-dependent methyltransferase [Podospora australis]|uniref:S-adenosyl-L-methionine-dependent methyltransferase n=1 Tax=Podospora australis TaxID=1536484 RepID=A0AAN7AEI0_9PEZI|nr:S-adenosyl-L-methionine-dependent methyltransferase [Podospora australis]
MALPSKQEVDDLVKQLTEAANAYDASPSLDAYLGRANIISKAKELQRALITPEMSPNYLALNLAEALAIRTFMRLKIFDAIPETGGISIEDLSKATGAQESLLERISRILVGTSFLSQPDANVLYYHHTKTSLAYRITPGTPAGDFFATLYDFWFKKAYNLDEYFVAHDQLTSAQEPADPLHNPFTWSSKQEGTHVFQIIASKPEDLAQFQRGMLGIDVAIPTTGHFDFSVLANSPGNNEKGVVELVDVGGGHGKVLSQILAAHKELSPKNTVLQEMPEVAELARTNGVLPEGVRVEAHDFLTPETIKGAKAYFMRMIMHDYNDPVATHILKNVASAMDSNSRVLICDMVLPQKVGEADFAAAVMDQCVMTMGGKERTELGFRKIFEAAGLELVKVWRAPGVPGGCVEGRLKRE